MKKNTVLIQARSTSNRLLNIVMKYFLENFSKYAVVKTNYQLKKDTIPFEYSLCVYKK